MQMDDILKAAIHDAGLESNLDSILTSHTEYSFFTSPPSSNSSTSCYTNNNDQDLLLSDLDFSILSEPTTNVLTPSSSEISSSSVSPVSQQDISNCNLMLTDDDDPFLLALKQLDEENIKIEENVKNITNFEHKKTTPIAEQKLQNRKIIKINSLNTSSQNIISYSSLKQTVNTNNKTTNQPIVRLVSINQKKIETKADNNDLNNLINFRNNSKTTIPTPPVTPKSTTINLLNKPNNNNNNNNSNNSNSNNPVKVINLSQFQQKQLQERLISTNVCQRIIKIQNNSLESKQLNVQNVKNSTNLPQANNTTSSNNIKITKVVSSRPVLNYSNSNTNNVVYFNKTNNKLVHVNSAVNLSNIQKKVQSDQKSQSVFIAKTPSLGANLSNLSSKTIPKLLTTPKTITTTISNPPEIKLNLPNSKTVSNNLKTQNTLTTTTTTTNTHLSVLNSNLSRMASQNSISNNNQINVSNTTTTTTNNNNITNTSSNSITNNQSVNSNSNTMQINPKFLFNINNSNPNAPNNQPVNKILNNNDCVYYEPDEEVVVEEEEELGHAETYANYMPSKLKLGLKHPDPIVETSSLASVEPPDVWYDLKMPSSVYENGALSALQLEAVVYACQKHTEFLPNNHRCGFLIGDGAGVGKGRTIAGIIYENYLQGRKKALWLSVSNDLKYDAQRDFSDIGAENLHVHALNKLKYNKISSAQNSNIKKGVIFSTYSSLIGESQQKSENKKYTSRLKQLLQWLGGESFDGVIVFDECHKAKNLVPVGSAKPTKTGLAVLELQEKLPNARIVYASATGASEPKNMAYMVRLGLWGTGTPFNDFNDFIQSIEKRGVGAMEIVAIDMKLRGMYMARQLSFSGVTFKIEEIPLKNQYIKMYDDSVKLWVEMKEKFQEALDLVDQEGKLKKTVWGQFWSSHQRFFKYLCMACKVPYVVDLAKKALSNKKCVVIGLQSTGEARTLEHIDEGGEMNDFVSTARGVLQNLVEKHFPTSQNPLNQQEKQKNSKVKNSQKVNDIFHRLSSYTNSKNKRKKISKNRSSSLSSECSISSLDSSLDESDFDDSDDFDDENFSSDLESLISSPKTKKNDFFDFDFFSKSDQNDSGVSVSSKSKQQKSDNFESDDSDSLFSITKCVSVQGVNNKNKKPKSDEARVATKRQKKRKKIQNLNLFENEEEDDDIEEIDNCNLLETNKESEKPENSDSDDDFKLPAKRLKNDENNKTEQKEIDIQDPFGFSISTLKRPNRPKPTKPHEIDEYIHEIKSDLLNTIRSLGKRLPANTLDELIDLLDGPDHVAEMTGRKGRIVSQKDGNNQNGNYVYETRNESDVPVELMNVVQKERFMNGEKLVAIISEAASSGISLQANRRNSNQYRRVHITIELPWSADRAIQQFGRTHRSNQVSAPEYIFLISQLAGEKRFASTVAKRLESLGALTHGDRRATESRDLSRFNIDNKYGRAALENVIKSICNSEKPLARIPKTYQGDFMSDAREALHGVGMIVSNKNGSAYPEKDYNNINKFLNRLLGCPVLLQNAIFTFFSDILAAVILQAKRTGKWDMGILDLGSNNEIANRKETKFYVLNNNGDTSRRVEMHTVLVERGMTWEKALEIYKQNLDKNSETGFYLSTQVKNSHRIAILAVPSVDINKIDEKIKRENLALSIYRPNTGLQVRLETPDSLDKKYKKVTPSEAKSHWVEQYQKSVTECTHVYRQGHCSNLRNCDIGLRTRKFYILAGSVLTVWTRVENVLCHLTGSSQFRLQIIRVKTSDNFKIVGCVIPTMCVKQVDQLLGSISSKSYVQNHIIDYDDENNTNSSKKAKLGAQTNSNKKSNININGDINNKNTSCSNANSSNCSINEKNFKTQYLNYDFT